MQEERGASCQRGRLETLGNSIVSATIELWEFFRKSDEQKLREREDSHLIAEANRQIANYAKWQTGAILLNSALTLFTLLVLTQAMEGVAKRLVYTHPPKLLITNFSIRPSTFRPGAPIDGIAYVVNVGSSAAHFSKSQDHDVADCVVFWSGDNLPMIRPYDCYRSGPECSPPKVQKCTGMGLDPLESGGVAQAWHFKTTASKDALNQSLYVAGKLIYRDDFNGRHATLFARKYDAKAGHFVKVKDNEDYQSDE